MPGLTNGVQRHIVLVSPQEFNLLSQALWSLPTFHVEALDHEMQSNLEIMAYWSTKGLCSLLRADDLRRGHVSTQEPCLGLVCVFVTAREVVVESYHIQNSPRAYFPAAMLYPKLAVHEKWMIECLDGMLVQYAAICLVASNHSRSGPLFPRMPPA